MSRALVSVSPSDPADVLGTWPSADAGAVDAAVSRARNDLGWSELQGLDGRAERREGEHRCLASDPWGLL